MNHVSHCRIEAPCSDEAGGAPPAATRDRPADRPTAKQTNERTKGPMHSFRAAVDRQPKQNAAESAVAAARRGQPRGRGGGGGGGGGGGRDRLLAQQSLGPLVRIPAKPGGGSIKSQALAACARGALPPLPTIATHWDGAWG